jgi:hypothetical protein
MIFTKLGRAVALIALVGGILYVISGVSIAAGLLGPEQAALAHLRVRSLGVLFDRGINGVLFSIALGILTEISFSVRAQRGT